MKYKTLLIQMGLILLFIILILNPKASFEGAGMGLTLWATTVLPGLFPAMIISSAILKFIPMQPSYRYIYIIVCGLFCGYPLGAILCGQIHQSSPDEKICELIMPYCNVSSPSFIINYIMLMSCFDDYNLVAVLAMAYLPAIEALICIILFNRKTILGTNNTTVGTVQIVPHFTEIIDNSLIQSIKNILKLGGYITVFACLSTVINTIINSNAITKAIISGLIEITNGIFMCNALTLDNNIKVIIIMTINALGGISTIMQTMGMIKDTGLSIKKYIYHKVFFAMLTALNTSLVIYVLL